ncbi:hypothetical protein BG20_I1140 [Candidatus Nitrosarchaeum limnium BG20]|uniref:Uncharacterized protein n=1 Tax=Candidatus Nitrosarchaeum limnium BG20 TaxID=859192 RepID=S2E5U6_9ARCH|nr:hypothetical protein BG20_I1140 [Candidatus Nitrosarchaeum limnium BG20]
MTMALLMVWEFVIDMSCKIGFIHNFSYFAIQDKKMCINCGIEESNNN